MATKKSTTSRKGASKGRGKVGKVMHEFKHGELKSGSGRRVKNPKQAIAIGLSEAREAGEDVPRKRGAAKRAGRKTASKRSGSASRKGSGGASKGSGGASKRSGASRKSAGGAAGKRAGSAVKRSRGASKKGGASARKKSSSSSRKRS